MVNCLMPENLLRGEHGQREAHLPFTALVFTVTSIAADGFQHGPGCT